MVTLEKIKHAVLCIHGNQRIIEPVYNVTDSVLFIHICLEGGYLPGNRLLGNRYLFGSQKRVPGKKEQIFSKIVSKK